MKRTLRILALLSLVLAACAPAATPIAATVTPAAVGPTGTARALPASATTSSPAPKGDPVAGARTWAAHPCSGCHGAQAGGGDGPKLAGMQLTYDGILDQVRNGSTFMPGFTADQVSDQDVADILAWIQTLH